MTSKMMFAVTAAISLGACASAGGALRYMKFPMSLPPICERDITSAIAVM